MERTCDLEKERVVRLTVESDNLEVRRDDVCLVSVWVGVRIVWPSCGVLVVISEVQ